MFARHPHHACALLLILAGIVTLAHEAAQVACPSLPAQALGVPLEHAPAALCATPMLGQTHEHDGRSLGDVRPELELCRTALAAANLRPPRTLLTLCVCLLV